MKMKFWTFFAAMISTSLLAQQATNAPAPAATPAPAVTAPAPAPELSAPAVTPEPAKTNAPAKPAKKKTAKKTVKKTAPAAELKTTPLVSGPAVVSAHHVNVRSKAGLVGEVLTHVTNGQPVNVIEEIHLKSSAPDEPSAWAKIALPAEAPVWVKSSYIDANKTISAKKLNLRAGPSEHYGIVGTLQKGDTVQEIETKGEWTKIQAPTNAFAYVAAQYLSQDPTALAAANIGSAPSAPSEPAPAAAAVPEAPTVAAAPTEAPMVTNETPVVAATTNETAATPAVEPTPVPEEPLPPRIVDREGIVRGSFSIQAPTKYELISPDNHRTINYLYTTSTNLDLSRYKGMHIVVSGEEGLDERWKNTPVITIQKIVVLE